MSEKETKLVEFSLDKSFIAAKAILEVKPDCEVKIICREGYDLYWSYYGTDMKKVDNTSCGLVTIENSSKGKRKFSLKKEDAVVTIIVYLIKNIDNTGLYVNVPIGSESIKGWLELIFKITNIETFMKNFPDLNWESVYDNKNHIKFEYLSEYFIDSENKQNGVSIGLRRLVKNAVLSAISNDTDISQTTEIIGNIEKYKSSVNGSKTMKDIFQQYCIELNYAKMHKKDQPKEGN